MKILVLLLMFVALVGCGTVNLANTVAGGACGTVDYRITFLGTPLFGIQAERECIKDDE